MRSSLQHHDSLKIGWPLLFLLLAFGCGPGNPLGRKAIRGTVTLNGEPIESGTIHFIPIIASGVSSGSEISAGQFSIEKIKGLPPGEYLVRINSATLRDGAGGEVEAAPGIVDDTFYPGVEQIPARYNIESEEKIEVTKKGDNEFVFALEK